MLKPIVRQSGFTMIEVLVTIAIMAVTTYLALPSVKAMYSLNEITSAQQSVAQSLRKAKQFARSINTTITVTFTLNDNDNTIALTLPDGSSDLPSGISMQTIELPSKIAVSSDDSTYSFNSLGVVDKTGVITVTSSRDDSKTKTVTLLNLLGQLQVN